MIFECQKLRDAPNGKPCVRCGARRETTVGAHYTGMRRDSYGGGLGQKCWDICIADFCDMCHEYFDRVSREKSKAIEHSEEFQHYIIVTIMRRIDEGVLVVSGRRESRPASIPKIFRRPMA